MPETKFSRSNILEAYHRLVRPTGRDLPALPANFESLLGQSSFALDFSQPLAQSSNGVLPETARITPMDHQSITGSQIAENLQLGASTAILGDPLGAGKTLTAILAYLNCRQYQPELGLIITVPDTVIPDWKLALAQVGIDEDQCATLTTPTDIEQLAIANLPPILLVKQSLSLSTKNISHKLSMEKMKAIYQLPRMHIYDEQISFNATFTILYELAQNNPRVVLSGTIVTNSIQDVAKQLMSSQQAGTANIHHWMASISNFFTRYFTTSFAGTAENLPGKTFIQLLNLASILHRSLYSRFSFALPIQLPPFEEHYRVIDAVRNSHQTFSVREEPRMLLGATGVTVAIDESMDRSFRDSNSPRWFDNKLSRLLDNCLRETDPHEFNDKLVITANQSTSNHLERELGGNEAIAARYCIIPLHTKSNHREEMIKNARKERKSIIFITEDAKVEGFNIQQHLSNIVFFDAVRDAGDYIQAVGRAVRRGNLSAKVTIEQYCVANIVEYVKTRIGVTRKAKSLLELLHADPTLVYMLLVGDEFLVNRDKIRPNVTQEAILTSLNAELEMYCHVLTAIGNHSDSRLAIIDFLGVQSTVDIRELQFTAWRSKFGTKPPKVANQLCLPFLFSENLEKYAFDGRSAAYFFILSQTMEKLKWHLQQFITTSPMNQELLRSDVIGLIQSFNLHEFYLSQLLEKVTHSELNKSDAVSLLRFAYSSLGFASPLFLEMRKTLSQHIAQLGLFQQVNMNEFVEYPYLLTAFLESKLPAEDMLQHLSNLVSEAELDHIEVINRFLLALAIHPSAIAKTLYRDLQPFIIQFITGLETIHPQQVFHHPLVDGIIGHVGLTIQWLTKLLNYVSTIPTLYIQQELLKRCKSLIDNAPQECKRDAKHIKTKHEDLFKLITRKRNIDDANYNEDKVKSLAAASGAIEPPMKQICLETPEKSIPAMPHMLSMFSSPMPSVSSMPFEIPLSTTETPRSQEYLQQPQKPQRVSSVGFFNSSPAVQAVFIAEITTHSDQPQISQPPTIELQHPSHSESTVSTQSIPDTAYQPQRFFPSNELIQNSALFGSPFAGELETLDLDWLNAAESFDPNSFL